jgi:ferredoxin
VKYFKKEYETHIRDKKCPAGVCKALISYQIKDENCTACMLCVKNCPTEAITGGKAKEEPPTLNADKCIKCGICYEVCNYDAVERG